MMNLKRNYDEPRENLYMSKKYVPFQDKELHYPHVQVKSLKKASLASINNKQHQVKYIKNSSKEESCQLHRYLKEYQYNIYQPQKTEQDQIKYLNDHIVKSKQTSKPFSKGQVQKDLAIKYDFLPQNRYSLKYSSSNVSYFDDKQLKNNQNKENFVNNHQFSFIGLKNEQQNSKCKKSSSIQTSTKTTEKQVFISKQEIVLLKHLREQNNQLKIEISKKNSYIVELQQKLQTYLKERIQNENQAHNLCKSLENRLLNAQNQTKKLQQEIQKYKESEKQHKKSLQFIFKAIRINPSGDICNSQLQKMTNLLKQILQQKTTFDEFIHKIDEMRNKIESKSNKKQSGVKSHQNINSHKVKTNKPVNLKQLWKWLKLVAKQYEVMKEKVLQIQKDQLIVKN